MHRNLYTSSFYAQILFHREVCAQINFYTQTPLHTEVFTQKKNTQRFLHTDALHNCTKMLLHAQIKAHKRIYTQNLLHRETFAQNNFYAKKFSHRKTLTQKKCHNRLHHEVFTHHFFLHAKTLPRAVFPHRHFSAQKPLRTEVSMDSSFYTDAFTHRCLYTQKLLHTNLSTQHAFTHSQFLHGEALLPLLDHLPFVFPLSSILRVYVICREIYLYIYIQQDFVSIILHIVNWVLNKLMVCFCSTCDRH